MKTSRQRAVNLYTIEADGAPVAQAEAISQTEAVALWVASQQQPTLSARLSTPREARALAHLPLLSRGAEPERDPRVPDMFDDAPAEVLLATYCPPVELAADHAEDALEMAATPLGATVAPEHSEELEKMAKDAEELFAAGAHPQWLHAEGIMAREVLAFDAGRDIGTRGLKRFSAEMLEADVMVLRNVRSEQDTDKIHAELLRGFDAGRDERGNASTIPPKGAGKVEAKYRNPEDGASWSGRGLKPRWLVAAIDAGRSMDEFLIPLDRDVSR